MRKVLLVVFGIVFIGAISYLIYYQFANPDMTSTRRLFNTWHVCLIGICSGLIVLAKIDK